MAIKRDLSRLRATICIFCREGRHSECTDYLCGWNGMDILECPADWPWCDCDHDGPARLVPWKSPRTAITEGPT